ncbi:MAG TPA: hypothetical protein VGR62_17750 [Candidatus Binatia bacterium]|jgi:hypothetical protein|nr:hypothetical protein [Candidatus Binatia bacterium]
MRTIRPRLVVAVVALLLAPAIGLANCPDDCDIKGGSSKTDCLVGFDAPDLSIIEIGSKNGTLRCTDGSSCDADGVADGVCTFGIVTCLKNTVPFCQTNRVLSVDVKNDPVTSPRHDPSLQAIEDALTALVPAEAPVCTAPVGLTVPLKLARAGVFRSGTKVLRVKAISASTGTDADKVVATCLPSSLFPAP